MAEYKGRCMRCKDQRDIAEPQVIEMTGKGGSKRKAVKGKCATCGCSMYKFLPKDAPAPAKAA
jgi:hypothetical protein